MVTKKKQNAMHLSESAEWFTPVEIITATHSLMGAIDLDPASNHAAQKRVKAAAFYDEERNGLVRQWNGRVFLNPPGDKQGRLPKAFWSKLIQEYVYGDVTEAVYLGFSLEQLVSLQSNTVGALVLSLSPLDFPLCVPKRRLSFMQPDGTVVKGNTHGSFISYLGWRQSRFREVFKDIGDIR